MKIRCKNCGKLLGQFEGKGEVKCTRAGCGAINAFNTAKGSIEILRHVPMKDRATSSGHTFR